MVRPRGFRLYGEDASTDASSPTAAEDFVGQKSWHDFRRSHETQPARIFLHHKRHHHPPKGVAP